MRSAAVRIDEAVGRRPDRRVVAGGTRGGHPLLGLQRSAGNAAVVAALRVQRSCCGGCAAGGACQKDQMPLQREVDQATASRNSAGDPEPLSMQPVGLRDVLLQSSKDPDGWWSGLDHQRRMALVDVYNRLTTFGLWQHVRAVKRVVKGEAPWHGLQAPGLVESIEFDVKNGRSLMEDLLYTPKMCMDDAISGALHPGQTSFRQFGTTGSLHASVGPGANDADAHVDKLTPPKGKNADHTCDQDMPEAMRHIGQEVVPEKVRGKTHIPGFQLNPDFINTHPGAPSGAVTDPAQRDDPHMSAGITLNF